VFDPRMGCGSVASGEQDCFVLVALQCQNVQHLAINRHKIKVNKVRVVFYKTIF